MTDVPLKVPQGWRLVPETPTEIMLQVGCGAYWPMMESGAAGLTNGDRLTAAYGAMLAASPLPPEGASPVEKVRDLLEAQGHNCTDPYMIGLYNGLELALCTMEDREPKFIPSGSSAIAEQTPSVLTPPAPTLTDAQKAAQDDAYVEGRKDENADCLPMIAWAYAKLHRMNFSKQEDALMLDRMKLLLEHGVHA